jgi:hypothetical protein
MGTALGHKARTRTRACSEDRKGGGKAVERGCCDSGGQLAVPAIWLSTTSATAPASVQRWGACRAARTHVVDEAWIHKRMSGKPTPNVRAKLPAEACSVSLVCEGAEGAAHQAYAACRSGSA